MPMATKEAQREYQRNWVAKRRHDWFKENGPCVKCGSKEELELDHINPETKITHAVWSWSEARRLEELSKCQVLCRACHDEKTKTERQNVPHGTASWYRRGCKCELCRNWKRQAKLRENK